MSDELEDALAKRRETEPIPPGGRTHRDRIWGILAALGVIVLLLGGVAIDTRFTAKDSLAQSQDNATSGDRTRALSCTSLQSLVGEDAMRQTPQVAETCFGERVRRFYDPGQVIEPAQRFCLLLQSLEVEAPGCEAADTID